MNVSLEAVPKERRETIERLMQLYIYDFTEITGTDCSDQGSYDYPHLPLYWSEPGRHAFLVRLEGKVAGFALINSHSESAKSGVRSVAEFFILRKYRRQGVGTSVAKDLLKRFPGK